MKAKRSELGDKILYDESLSRKILEKILVSKNPDINVTVKNGKYLYKVSEMKK
jgi:hypothetical protein